MQKRIIAVAAALAVVGGENVKAALGGEVTLRSLEGSYVPRTGALILVGEAPVGFQLVPVAGFLLYSLPCEP